MRACIFVIRRSEAHAEALFVEKMTMATDHILMLFFFFFFFVIHFQFYHALHLSSASPLLAIASPSQTTLHLLQDVLKNISASENWNLKNVRISEVYVGEARFLNSQIYEFSVNLGKNPFSAIDFSDDFVSWKKFRKPKSDLHTLIHGVTSQAIVDSLEIQGPLELRVDPPHQLSLSLPMNISHAGLKRVLVGEGITLGVRRALQVWLRYSSDHDLAMDGSMTFDEYESDYRPFLSSSTCIQLVYVRVSGLASLSAHVERNPDLLVETVSIPQDGILLIPDKGLRSDDSYRNGSSCPYDALSMRISMGEKIWRSLVGPHNLRQNDPMMSVSLEANRKATSAVKIGIGLEREVLRNYIYEWRRRHLLAWFRSERRRIEWVRFQAVATVEADEQLKILSFKKSARPIPYWQDVNSNKSSPTLDHHHLPYFYFCNLLL